jgi:hypothetical protein
MASRLLLSLVLLVGGPAWAAAVAGIQLDDTARVAGSELKLAGAGLRKRVFFNVYVIGLYVQDPKADPVTQPGPKRVALHMLRDVGAETFTEALTDGIRANHNEAQVQAFEPRVKQLAATIAQIKEAKKGMTIALEWNGATTQVLVDGKPAGSPIGGEDFYAALLRIWLGHKPVQEDLKKALLGAA